MEVPQDAAVSTTVAHQCAALGAQLIPVAGFALVYFLAALTGIEWTREADNVAALWLPNALLLAALLRTDPAARALRWPLYLGAGLVANFASNLWFGDTVWVALGFVGSNTLEVLAGVVVADRLSGGGARRNLPFSHLLVGALAVIVLAPALGASAGAVLLHYAYGADVGAVWRVWWLADAMGLAIVTPLALSATRDNVAALFQPERRREALLLILVAAGLTLGVFLQFALPALFLVLPVLLWSTFRFGLFGCALTGFIITLCAVSLTVHGYGPLPLTPTESIQWLQLFLGVTVMPMLLVAVVDQHRHRSVQAHQLSEARYRQLYQQTPAMLLTVDGAGCLLDVNQQWLAVTGYRRDEALGRPAVDFLTPASRRAAAKHAGVFQRSGRLRDFACQLEKKNGDCIDALVSATAERDAAGRITRTQAVALDVTRRNAAERARKDSERRMTDFAAASADWFWETDAEGCYTWFSDNVETYTGVPPAWHYGKNRLTLLSGIEPDAWAEHRAAIAERQPFKDLIVYRDGPTGGRWVRSNGVPVYAADGVTFRGYRGSGTDITALRLAEQRAASAERRLAEAIEGVQEAFALYDADERLLICNSRYTALYGAVGVTIGPGMSYEAFLCAQLATGTVKEAQGRAQPWLEERLGRFRNPGEPFEIETAAGTWMLVHERRLADGGTLVVGLDISVRKLTERALAEEKQRLQVTLHSIGDAVITTDAETRITFMNPVAEALTGWPLDEACGRALETVFQIVHSATGAAVKNPVRRCLAQRRTVSLPDHALLISRGGERYAIQDSAAPICAADGQLHGAVMVFQDVTEARELSRQTIHQASHDALTGLINRREFEHRLRRLLKRARQRRERHVLCYLDLDKFKIVNDSAGHIAGDALLKQIAYVLGHHVRQRDTLARLGGDEFALVLESCPLDNAVAIAEQIVGAVRDIRFSWDGRVYEVGVSVGLTVVSADASSLEAVLSQADAACYSAKGQGRNRVAVYCAEDSDSARRHQDLQRAATLRQALDNEQFCLYGQPIRALADGGLEPAFYELLVRLRDGDGNLIPPGTFMPAAERYHLMPAVDRWVIRTALRHYAPLFTSPSGVGMTVNLSATSINDKDLLAFIDEQLDASPVPPERICFEITETAAVNNLAQAAQFVHALRKRRCRVALDDFGSGFCSVRYLKMFPVDYLKIDGGFVRSILHNPVDREVVASLNRIGHLIGVKTIAEYVEDDRVAERLTAIGIDLAQGYGIGRPVPLAQLLQARGLAAPSDAGVGLVDGSRPAA